MSRDVAWAAGVMATGGQANSTTMFYALSPGRRLGWHANSVEEVQFVVEGSGELRLEDGSHQIGVGDLLLLKKEESHDILNTGLGDLRVVAFFPESEIEHRWTDEKWLPDQREVIVTRNR